MRKRPALRPALTLVVTIGIAATLGGVVYLASTSLPFLAASPTTDPLFGEFNSCLIGSLSERVGFAVSPDGTQAAAYGGAELALCQTSPDAGRVAMPRRVALPGITGAAFDLGGVLWLSTEKKGEGDPQLWRLEAEAPVRVGDFAPVALAGHEKGVAALDSSGRLISLSASGEALGLAHLPSAPASGAQLATNVDGTLLAVVAGTGLFVYRAADLTRVFAEGPCEVEYLWWLEEPQRALVSCAPNGSWALELQVLSGHKEAAPARPRVESTLVPRLLSYVQSCEHLPCSAPPP